MPANYCIIQYWTKPLPVQPVQLFCFLNVYLCVVCLFIMFWYPENFSVFHFLIHTPLNWSIMDGYLSLRCLQEHQNNKNIRTKMSLTSGDELIIWNNVCWNNVLSRGDRQTRGISRVFELYLQNDKISDVFGLFLEMNESNQISDFTAPNYQSKSSG